jgi:hypothetical protein
MSGIPRGGVIATREWFQKIDKDTFSSFAHNVLDTNIKLMTSLLLVIN